MAITDDIKRQRLDAVSHGETTAQIRSFLGSGAGASSKALVTRSQHAGLASPGPLLADAKRRAMSAISHVETVAQVGMMKLTGGIALYVARIREADRDAGARQAARHPASGWRTIRRDHFER